MVTKQKFRITSDWHLSHYGHEDPVEFLDKILPRMEDESEQILLIAGDMVDCKTDLRYWEAALKQRFLEFDAVFYVLGNHDFYFNKIGYHETVEDTEEWMANLGCIVLDDKQVDSDDNTFNLIGSTLWSEIDPAFAHAIEYGMNDYRVIKYSNEHGKLTTADTTRLSAQAIDFIKTVVNSDSVILTHHLPSFQSVNPRYAGSILNSAFASNYEWLIEGAKPKLWVHGHTHDCCDYTIGQTRIVCNPVGYPGENSLNYNPTLIVEV